MPHSTQHGEFLMHDEFSLMEFLSICSLMEFSPHGAFSSWSCSLMEFVPHCSVSIAINFSITRGISPS